MTNFSTRKLGIDRFKKHIGGALAITFLCSFVATLSVLLSFFLQQVWYLVFFFVAIPIFFVGHATSISMLLGQPINLKNTFTFFGKYFNLSFFGCYKVLRSLLKTIGCYFAIIVTVLFVFTFVLRFADPNFMTSVQEVMEAWTEYNLGDSGITFNDILTMNGGLVEKYMLFVIFPSSIISSTYFIYNISINSLNIYLRMTFPSWNPRVISLIEKEFKFSNRWKVKKDNLLLNWPNYLLMLVFGVGGLIFGYYFANDFLLVENYGLLFIAISSLLFLPTYFFKMQCLFEKYEIRYKESALKVASSFLSISNSNGSMPEEERDAIKKVIDELNKEVNNKKEESSNDK